ncbi:putative membrane protein [Actinoplanes missouriensis 431]|uniref:Putative membrane protein n=1 Tax=Actinoplanes missouriensis (strain ATCC 14538 / DSM 43046 / CBS 188.64 / JCM 3121 / NBRC 102363 / NCIMB 12654 / NRRL B-3342 / UNCC 431) TaxID=512565 RepID=I0HGE3_ACTM4|nr:trimeric intracellular cation channel family protein [Actinoplanes missouriensis]BAL92080.1 putative membrane protein [Actinoplanes missouriensis 431]
MTGGYGLLVADLIGVAVFAASGATAGVAKRLDLFGVAFVGFVAALGGGILRDLAIGSVPPLAFADWRYAVTAVAASLAAFWLHPTLNRLRRTVLLLDAAGLGLFTATGTLKAIAAGVPPVGACLLGMLTAIGGGLARDLLTGEIPVVLRREIYAVVALGGAVLVTVMHRMGFTGLLPLVGAAGLMTGVRLLALYRKWSAPVAAPRF